MPDDFFDKPSSLDERLTAFEVPARRLGSIPVKMGTRSLKTGFTDMEKNVYVRHGEPDLVIVGARPGNGKTSFLVQLLMNIAKNEGPTMMFSLEMSGEQLIRRAIAGETGQDNSKLHLLQPGRMDRAREAINKLPFFVDDTKGMDINLLRARALDLQKHYGKLQAVGVDYLQIVGAPEGWSKRDEVMEVAEGLKKLAEDLNAPVIALAQMSREIERRQQQSKTARPVMSDLAECGGLESWADQILFLDGAGRRDPSRAGEIDVYVAKNRHGDTKDFILRFDGPTTRFSDFGGGEGL
jgi:replicative DNA helicase